MLPQQEFDQEGQLLTNAGFTLQTTTPGGRVRIARTDLHLYDAGQRSGPPHAVTGVDVVAQFGDKTYLATVTVQTTATDNPNYVRDCHDNPQGIQGAARRGAARRREAASATISHSASHLQACLIDRPQQPESQTPIGAGPPEPPLWCHAT